MVKVSLRVYNREIEGMIEGGHLDEAVAHCQHILKTFPMHVETYRLLGKSFLEARRYTDAADIFQRALMAVPDDFVVHVGMSIIRDDEGKLDDAIWHMERAFEAQPSNPAIQGELRRLYGRRDGVEPPKIRLSRDALANMYSQGELFNQAIAEIRAVLAEDANRPDLQVMLARAYYRSGQKVEAAEMAANLLKKYTYCMDALRILVDVLPGGASGENTQIYRQRLGMLDPYSSFVTGSMFNTYQVAETAVNLERLDYIAGAVPASPQPNWASSLGIKLVDEKRSEPAPDWMNTGDPADQFQVAASDSFEPAAAAADDKSVPDWMRTAGWQESNDKAQEGSADSNLQQPAESLAKADIPDWLKSMAPQELTNSNTGAEPAPANPPASDEGDTPDWLAGLGTAAGNINPDPSQPAVSSQDNGAIPDWLKETGDSTSAGTAETFTAEVMEQPKAEVPHPSEALAPVKPPVATPRRDDDDTPFQPTGESKPLTIEDDAMAWLEGLAAKQGAKEEELLSKPENRSGEMPDWLRSADEQPSAPATPAPVAEVLASQEATSSEELPPSPISSSDEMPDWLHSADKQTSASATPEPVAEVLASQEATSSEELPPSPISSSDEMPDWLRSVNEQPTTPVAPEPSPIPGENATFEPFSPHVGEFAVQEPALSEELPSLPKNSSDDMPEWLRSADDKPASFSVPVPSSTPGENVPLESVSPHAGEFAANEPAPSEELPSFSVPTEGIPQPLSSEDDTVAWLESLAAEQGAKKDELPTNPSERTESSTDWVQKTTRDLGAPDEVLTPENPQATPDEDISITSWLSKLDVEEALGKTKAAPDSPQPAAAPSTDLPDWLKGLEKPVAPEEAPKPVGNLPNWLDQPAQPVDKGPDSVPIPEPTMEPELPAWVDETILVSEPPAPTTPGEWVPVNEKPTAEPAVEPVAIPASSPAIETPIQRQVPRGTGMLSRVPTEDKDAESMSAAQAALDANQLDDAMKIYAKLIKKNRLLDEVIHDFREAIYRFPVDIIVWQTLGDASMRANRLQDALDAYTKAEELLR